MTVGPVWLIPIDGSGSLPQEPGEALRVLGIEYVVVAPEDVRNELGRCTPPLAVVQGRVTTMIVEVQRWLGDFFVLTMILVEG